VEGFIVMRLLMAPSTTNVTYDSLTDG
jgi:hypothetical protein